MPLLPSTLKQRWRRLPLRARVGLCLLGVGGLAAGGLAVVNLLVTGTTEGRIYDELAAVPERRVALVLGAGLHSEYLQHRLDAAYALYAAGKVEHLLVSGDNQSVDYNEPAGMKRSLVGMGVPAEAITCDYAGLRTLDSVVRAKAIFGQQRLVIVSQHFHLNRALFLAAHHDIDAVGFSATDAELLTGDITLQREWLARALAVADLYVLNRQPRYLGDPEPIALNKPPGDQLTQLTPPGE